MLLRLDHKSVRMLPGALQEPRTDADLEPSVRGWHTAACRYGREFASPRWRNHVQLYPAQPQRVFSRRRGGAGITREAAEHPSHVSRAGPAKEGAERPRAPSSCPGAGGAIPTTPPPRRSGFLLPSQPQQQTRAEPRALPACRHAIVPARLRR